MLSNLVAFFHSLLPFYLKGYDEGDTTADLIANEALNSHFIILNVEVNHYES